MSLEKLHSTEVFRLFMQCGGSYIRSALRSHLSLLEDLCKLLTRVYPLAIVLLISFLMMERGLWNYNKVARSLQTFTFSHARVHQDICFNDGIKVGLASLATTGRSISPMAAEVI